MKSMSFRCATAEPIDWLSNVQIKNPDKVRYADMNRKLRLMSFLD